MTRGGSIDWLAMHPGRKDVQWTSIIIQGTDALIQLALLTAQAAHSSSAFNNIYFKKS